MASLELAAFRMSQVLPVLQGLRIANINAVSATAVLAYDVLITSGQEIRHIWRASWTLVKVLYILTRYYALVFLLFKSFVATHSIAPGKFCNHYLRFEIWGSAAFIPIVDIIITARIYALYNRSARMALFLAVLWLAETIGGLVLIKFAMRPMSGPSTNPLPGVLLGCYSRGAPDNRFLISFWALVSVVQAVYVILTMAKFVEWGREFGFGMSPLLTCFFRDGTGYFLIIMAVNILNTLLDIYGSVELQESGDSWIFAVTSITACRLVLNLRRSAEATRHAVVATGAELRVVRLAFTADDDDEDDDDNYDDRPGLPK